MASHTLAPFPPELLAAKKEIREQARSYGLDFFDVIFEMCDYEQMNQIAAYGGFPQRYPHWRFGSEYEGLHIPTQTANADSAAENLRRRRSGSSARSRTSRR